MTLGRLKEMTPTRDGHKMPQRQQQQTQQTQRRPRAPPSSQRGFEQPQQQPLPSPGVLYGSSFPPPSYAFARTPGVTASHSDLSKTSSKPFKSRPNPRTTKVTQKLVLFPEDLGQGLKGDEGLAPEEALGATGAARGQPSGLDALNVYVPDMLPDSRMTEAERLSKDSRSDFPRVSSYCVAEGFRLEAISRFVRDTHSTYQKTFDECLYVYYEEPAKKILFGDLNVTRLGKQLRFMG